MPSTMKLCGVRNGPAGELVDLHISAGRVLAIAPPGWTEYESSDCLVVQGRGGTLLPGLRDAHVHASQWATTLQRVDLSGAASAMQAARTMARAARDRPSAGSDVLTGYGFRDGLWPEPPTKQLLDELIPGVAVSLISHDLHCVWLSSAALRLIGLQHPTGVLREAACFDAVRRLPEASPDQVDRWVRHALPLAAARGVTSISDFEFTDTIGTWQRRAAAGPLAVRITAAVYQPHLPRAIELGYRTGDLVADTQGMVTVGPAKVLMDGSLNTRTALCHHPYPGLDGVEAYGLLTQDPQEISATMAATPGFSFAVHAIGDRANTLALDCFERSGQTGRIEHAQLLCASDVPRFAQLGVIAGVQPAHAVEDRDVADRFWPGRTADAFAYRTLSDAGATMEFGSDAPVSRLDPWHAIACAVTRTEDDRPPWHAEQSLTFDQALRASTGGRTRVAVGDVADLVVVRPDPGAVDPGELREIEVLATVVDGHLSYPG